jgi:glycosyltransferase-like protein
MTAMRVAILTYSVRPRGGVVHALEIAGALDRAGHEVELMALGGPGDTFFRAPRVPSRIVRHEPIDAPFDQRIMAMLEAYRDGLAEPLGDGGFDIVHAQDCLSTNAAVELRDLGVIPHVVRTVHHTDAFRSASLIECQNRSILRPDAVLCVTRPWVDRLRREYGVTAGLVSNGVDTHRYRPAHDDAERRRARRAVGFDDAFTVLTVGGIEPRKGSLTLLDGFATVRALVPDRDPLLVVAGGATLFDYRDEIDRFRARAVDVGLSDRIRLLGTVADDELECLYRAADVLAFPSTSEGFGLAAIEAQASGLPVVASSLDAFDGFLEHERTALRVPVGDGPALGAALARVARDGDLRARLRAGGFRAARSRTWDAAAAAHVRAYGALLRSVEPVDARGG